MAICFPTPDDRHDRLPPSAEMQCSSHPKGADDERSEEVTIWSAENL